LQKFAKLPINQAIHRNEVDILDRNSTTSHANFAKHIRHVGRLAHIVNIFARQGFWSLFEASGIRGWLSDEQVRHAEELSRSGHTDESESSGEQQFERKIAQVIGGETGPRRFREALEQLGPAFVKFGQLLASREDLLPEAFLRELRKLHQDVAAIPYAIVRKVLVEELGERLNSYRMISETPLAAGSIGQVHLAELNDGTKVAIKIQRPNIADQIRVDLGLMELLAGLLEKYVPELRPMRPLVTVEELTRAIESELDYVREAGNTEKIADNFADCDFVQLPQVYWELSTGKVLTLSFIEGYSLVENQAIHNAGFDSKKLVENGLKMFLQMVFVDGLYHGDLHAGNILALPGERIGLIDCGLTIRLGRLTRENLAGLLVALVEEDYETLVSHFIELADPITNFNVAAFEDAVANELTPFVGLQLRKVRVGKLLWRLASIAAQHGAPMPRQLILFFRTLASFEGLGLGLSPDFDVLEQCQSFSSKLVKQMYSRDQIQRQGLMIARDLANLARFAPRQVRGLMKQIGDGELLINVNSRDMQFFANAFDRQVSRLAVSFILAALVIASSILVLARAGREYYHLNLFGLVGFAIAGVLSMYVFISIVRGAKKY
jgi:ubiquinone biosynthesis protein